MWQDTFITEGTENYLDGGRELVNDVKAWVRMPEPWEKSGEYRHSTRTILYSLDSLSEEGFKALCTDAREWLTEKGNYYNLTLSKYSNMLHLDLLTYPDYRFYGNEYILLDAYIAESEGKSFDELSFDLFMAYAKMLMSSCE